MDYLVINFSQYIVGFIIIIMSRYQYGYPWPSLAILPIVHYIWQVLRATFRIGTELLYVGSSFSSCLCSAMWKGPQGYITYELVPTSPTVSRMPGSSNFDSFRDIVVGDRTAAALCGTARWTCSLMLAVFLCSCRQAFFSIRLVSVHVVHPYSSIDTTAAWKKFYRSGLTSIWLIAIYAFACRESMSFLVDETLLPRSVKLSTSFTELPPCVEMSPSWLNHIYSVLYVLTWRPMPTAARSRHCSRGSGWAGAFARSAISSALSTSVIVFAGYLLLYSFVCLKPFSLCLSIDALST